MGWPPLHILSYLLQFTASIAGMLWWVGNSTLAALSLTLSVWTVQVGTKASINDRKKVVPRSSSPIRIHVWWNLIRTAKISISDSRSCPSQLVYANALCLGFPEQFIARATMFWEKMPHRKTGNGCPFHSIMRLYASPQGIESTVAIDFLG